MFHVEISSSFFSLLVSYFAFFFVYVCVFAFHIALQTKFIYFYFISSKTFTYPLFNRKKVSMFKK
jgi:hypothetical protein